ncbi:MAG: YbhB/YbcL family Raf kinase inhibitor-like protein [Terriglobales bacterium]
MQIKSAMGRQARTTLWAAGLLGITILAMVAGRAWMLYGWTEQKGAGAIAFVIQTAAFSAGGDIPKKFTCDGADVSPALSWNQPPAGTVGLALIADDPDAPAGTWVHWVLYDLPASARGLPEGVPQQESLASGARQGRNDFRRIGYNGPCPPPGQPHRYFFKLYALSAALNLKPGLTKRDLEQAMKGKVLGESEVMGRYAR